MKCIDVEWTPDMISLLTGFWAEGVSASEIGRRMGVSRNSIVGKAHRLGLPKRPSPIRWKPKPPKLLTLADIKPGQCLFPDGEPGTDGFNFCGEPVIKGKPYCGPHYARTHYKPPHDKGVPFHIETIGAK